MKNRAWLTFACAAAMAACAVRAQVVTEAEKLDPNASAELQAFKARVKAANPGMEVVSVEADVVKRAVLAPQPQPQNPKIAIFVKNQTRVPGMDDAVDGVRDRISAELAGAGLIVLDKAEIADGFNRFKITTAEERAGLVNGIFTGGSTVRVAQMLGCEYVMLVSIIGASHTARMAGDKAVTVYTLRMTTKVNEAANGSSVYGSNWTNKLPVPGQYTDGGDAMNYYEDLFDQWSTATGEEIAGKVATWRRAAPVDTALVEFSVSSTVDELIQGLESGVRAPNELLDEMRRLVGGVTVELDGATVGSSPGTFKATPGLHQLRVSRQWMRPWQQTVNIQPGATFRVALELSDAGLQRYRSLEGFRAAVAIGYAEAVMRKGVKINFDTAAWRDVGNKGSEINLQQNAIQ
ncbi:MAG TPA: PEGA domain-containing protein [Kiritimatiellia bacterium]|nr:PEGA domain-containing protein [Kiritimatiellia bacterium]